MKKLISTSVILLGLAGGGYYYYESQKKPEIPEVMTLTISEGEIVEEVSASGTLQAKKSVGVGSFVSGRVEEVLVDYNDIVRKGQVLARIDTSILKTQVQIQEANIERQDLDLAQQRVQLADAKRNLARQKELFEKKLATQAVYEAAELAVSSREAQIASAEKAMVSARFQLDTANTNLGYATIVSPVDGVIVDKKVDPGVTVQSSQSVATLFTIAEDLTLLKLEGGVDEAEIGKVRQGMTVRFTVDAYANQTFMGEITMVRLNPTTQQNVVTYTTVAEVRNNDLRLKPGMTAYMRIEVSRRDNVKRIPNAALRFRPNNDMYAALKQEPPTPAGRGGGRGDASAPGAARGSAPATATPTATPAQAPAAGAARPTQAPQAAAAEGRGDRQRGGDGAANPFQGGDRSGGGRGGGMNATLTPEQLKQMEAIRQLPTEERRAAMAKLGINFGGGGGRGTGGRGDGAGRAGQARGGQTAAEPLASRNAQSIDELFPPIVRNPTRGQVYVLVPKDATHPYGSLKRLDIMQGITNGTFTELVSGPADLQVGTELVSNISMPWLAARTTGTTQGNPFSGQQPGRGMPGMPTGMGGSSGRGGGGGR